MKKILFVAISLCLLGTLAAAQNVPTLKNVKKIYVAELGKQPESDLIREKIRLRLMKSGRFTVVDKPEDADATLTFDRAGLAKALLGGDLSGVVVEGDAAAPMRLFALLDSPDPNFEIVAP